MRNTQDAEPSQGVTEYGNVWAAYAISLMGGDHMLRRVEYRIAYGLVLRCVVEPLRPS